MNLNLPNKLTVTRMCAIPVFMFFVIFPVLGEVWSPIVATALFIAIALTDMLDGRIARARNLITDFGKFLDPLADKMLIFGGYIALLASPDVYRGTECEAYVFGKVFVWGVFIIILREMAVTSIRLVVSSGSKIVIAASWLGKIKTVTQMVSMCVLLVEPVFSKYVVDTHNIASYVVFGAAVLMTVWSGINYFIGYWPYINSNK